MWHRRLQLCFLLAISLGPSIAPGAADDAGDFFEARVRPVLAANCYRCHGTTQRRNGLRLDSREAMLRGGDSGPAIVPGDHEKSLLIQVVSGNHPDVRMPPKGTLSNYDIQALKQWVNKDAVWPSTPETTTYADSEISDDERAHWAYQPVRTPDVPTVSDADWSQNPVDAFLFRRRAGQGLLTGKPATKRALIRRATFDLTGLPPTPEEIAAFVTDQSPSAFESVVERLLDSPHYGERWGRHWLDLVRYADTAGDASDFPVPEAWKYRNYVIDAFNNDKPYDEFIREQIAGDLLPYETDDERWEQIIATGYIAISRRIGVSPQNLPHIRIEDTINNLGKTFLGLTVGCARCHDHKFDAVPTTDYYALYGIFASSVYPHPGAEHKPHREDFIYRVGKERADEILKPFREVLDVWDRKERAQLEQYRLFQRVKVTDPKLTRLGEWDKLVALREERRPYAEAFPDLEIAYGIMDGEPHDEFVQVDGDPKPRSRGPLVRRGFLQVLGGQKLPEGHDGSGRRELADWIADPANPLTARVIVNRIWHHHFGQGIVKSTSDFGVRGNPPTHPELLDYLAGWFTANDWSIKDVHRLLMLSRAYQLSTLDRAENSAIDPRNEFVWRANRRRLDAEQLRDSVLMFSRQLNTTQGERHPFPHRLTYFYRQHEPFEAAYPTNRRSVYMLQQRIQKDPYLDLFDGPDGNNHVGERKSTTTTLQALFLMNSEFMHEQSRAIAQNLLGEFPTPEGRINSAYNRIYGRPATHKEVVHVTRFIEATATELPSRQQSLTAEETMWPALIRTMLSSNEFLFID